MHLTVLAPHGLVLPRTPVARLVVPTRDGAHGIHPGRRDLAAAMPSGVLQFEPLDTDAPADGTPAPDTTTDGWRYVAIDEGWLVKVADEVRVVARHAVLGDALDTLRESVRDTFRREAEREAETRAVFAKLESGFLRRLMRLREG